MCAQTRVYRDSVWRFHTFCFRQNPWSPRGYCKNSNDIGFPVKTRLRLLYSTSDVCGGRLYHIRCYSVHFKRYIVFFLFDRELIWTLSEYQQYHTYCQIYSLEAYWHSGTHRRPQIYFACRSCQIKNLSAPVKIYLI